MMPWVFEGLNCHCGERHSQGVGYYVSVRNDRGEARLLAGPYAEHHQALAALPRAKDLACEYDARGHWYSYGTCAVHAPRAERQAGIFNGRL
jgi:hypothetical protein